MDQNTTAGKVGEPPAHYATNAGLQPFDVIDAFGLGFYDGNAFKYIARARHKGSRINDLEKAIHYLQEELIRAEKELASGG